MSDPPVEDETNNDPLAQPPGCRGWNHARSAKDGGPKQIAQGRSGVTPRKEPLDGGQSGADEPQVVDPREQLAASEHFLGSNDTPDNGSVVEGLGSRAGQALRLLRCADAADVAPEKVIGGNLDDGQPDDSE